MKNYPLWKSIIVIFVICTGIIFAIPSIIYSENPSNWFLNNKVNLGLDLQGGSYLLLEVETDVLLKEELENISDTVRQISRNEKANITNVIVEEDQIQFRFKNTSSIEHIRNQFIKKYNYVKVVINKNIIITNYLSEQFCDLVPHLQRFPKILSISFSNNFFIILVFSLYRHLSIRI